jgi:hypothetical protein
MEALYRNVRLPESVRGKGGWRSYAQALVRARCRIEDTCGKSNEDGALGFARMLISKRSFLNLTRSKITSFTIPKSTLVSVQLSSLEGISEVNFIYYTKKHFSFSSTVLARGRSARSIQHMHKLTYLYKTITRFWLVKSTANFLDIGHCAISAVHVN